MVLGVLGVIFFLPHGGQAGSFTGFFAMFLCLFALTGIGNGSTFMQVPAIFLTLHQRMAGPGEAAQKQATQDATREAAAVLGFTSAIGAYGGFFIPKSYGTSIAMTGGVEAALYVFIAFYLSCLAINGWYYARKKAEVRC
ncbi:nitrate/nitrite transporter, partial [Chromobacterium piscinae]